MGSEGVVPPLVKEDSDSRWAQEEGSRGANLKGESEKSMIGKGDRNDQERVNEGEQVLPRKGIIHHTHSSTVRLTSEGARFS